MREGDFIRLNAVDRHEQPPGASLLDRVEPIAGRGLRAEVQDGFGEAQHDPADGLALIECSLAESDTHAQCGAGNLHNNLLRGGLAAEKSGHSDHALHSDHPDFDCRSIRHVRRTSVESVGSCRRHRATFGAVQYHKLGSHHYSCKMEKREIKEYYVREIKEYGVRVRVCPRFYLSALPFLN